MIKSLLKPVYHHIVRLSKWKRRIGLNCNDFSIISNNCCAGYVYQYFGINYKTPTEGIGMTVSDYLKLMQRPKHYFTHKLEFVEPSTTQRYKSGEHFTYPAAKIDDITVYFRHYPTAHEAETKWIRRSKRINYDKLFFLLTESETLQPEHPAEFDDILTKQNNKGLLLSTKENPGQLCNYRHITQVPTSNGIPQWKPEIILKSIKWKQIINKL